MSQQMQQLCGMSLQFFFSEDFSRDYDETTSYNRALLEIEDILNGHNMSCHTLGLPMPTLLPASVDIDTFDPDEQLYLFNELYDEANNEQREIIDRVIRVVQFHDTGSNVFCLTAHAGCGKTFTKTAIIHRMNSLNLRCIATIAVNRGKFTERFFGTSLNECVLCVGSLFQ